MPALMTTLSHLGTGAGASGDAFRQAGNVQRATFQDAMTRNGAAPTGQAAPVQVAQAQVPPAQVSQAATPQPVTGGSAARPTVPVVYENSVASRERVRRSLELDGAQRPSDGDTILGGISKLRGAFDARHERLGAIMRSNSVDTEALLSMQMEVAQYSLLVDVSSKLTGKTTQSLDTLMKGS